MTARVGTCSSRSYQKNCWVFRPVGHQFLAGDVVLAIVGYGIVHCKSEAMVLMTMSGSSPPSSIGAAEDVGDAADDAREDLLVIVAA